VLITRQEATQQQVLQHQRPLLALPTLLVASILPAGCQTAPSQQEAEKQVGSPEITRLLRKNDCFKCRTVDRDKDGPSWQSVAEKYRDRPNAEEQLFKHLTSSPTITVNGKEEAHVSFKTTDIQEIINVVDWILSN